MVSDLAIALGTRLGRSGRAVRILRPAYSAWLNAAYCRRGMPWRLNGEPLRIHPAVRHLIPQDNERPLFEYLRAGIRPGDLIPEVNHHGDRSAWVSLSVFAGVALFFGAHQILHAILE